MNKDILPRMAVFIMAIVHIVSSYAQSVLPISGEVLDGKNREPLIGVTVVEKGTKNGVITDIDGKFSMRVPVGTILKITYMGYRSSEVIIRDNKPLTILLDEENIQLDELVVIGYGVQKKSDITGSISSVSGEELTNIPVSSPLQALQGKAAGVNIIQNTGAPGSSSTIKIRGTGTVNDADPLYVVDGFIVDGIDHLNANDIANIEILKDAASSAVYGARAANGVVVITTKGGASGKTKISFDMIVGFSNPWKKIDVLDAEEYALMRDYVSGNSIYSVDGRLYYSKDKDGGYYYDNLKYTKVDTIRRNSPDNWWDAITQTGLKQQYNLSVSGGTDRHKYMVSGSYYNEKGIVKTSGYERFNLRMNLDNQLNSWLNMTTNMFYTNENRNIVPEGSESVLKKALYQSPLEYLYNYRGNYNSNHPIAVIDRNHNKRENHRIDLNLNLTAKLGKLLTYQFKFSDYLVIGKRSRFYEVNKLDEDFAMPNDLTRIYNRRNQTNKWEINNLFTFAWKDKKHDISVLLGQTAEGYKNSWMEGTRKGTASNSSDLWFLSSGYTGDDAAGLDNEWTALGFVGRLSYNFLDRYLFQANFRADASSIFSKNERWGYFPSVSVGWKFTSEPFMQNQDWLSLGKLRFGWGQLGNNRINELSRYTLLNTEKNYSFGIGNHRVYPGTTSILIGNPDIHWEKTETFNVGLDLGLFNNRLTLGLEWFTKLTTDMLLRVPVPLSTGFDDFDNVDDDAPMTNAGSVRNSGVELSVNFRNKIKKFRYEIGFNVSYIKNKVVSLGLGDEPVYGGYLSESSILDYVTKTAVGKPIGSFFGYVTDGIFNSLDEVKASAQYDAGKNEFDLSTRQGDFRFKDLDNNGVIDENDREFIGNPIPDITYGLSFDATYKNFDLSILFQGVVGNEIYNAAKFYYMRFDGKHNVRVEYLDNYWAGENTSNTQPIPSSDLTRNNNNFRNSDYYVENGSYLRLKNIQLGYTFSPRFTEQFKPSIRVYVAAQNLFTLTQYSGFDPEVARSYSVDRGQYPQAQQYMIGVVVGF